ncbi:xylosyltransferase oxt-like isoform X1 [Artemia franciscana]
MKLSLKSLLRKFLNWRFATVFIVTFLASQGLFAYVLVSKYSCSGESCFSNEGKQRHLSPESLSKVHGRTGEDSHGFMQEAPKNKVFGPIEASKLKYSKENESKIDLSSHKLNFSCSIQEKAPLSAIKRAKSYKCKEEIGELYCKIQKGNVYPQALPNSCPNDNALKSEYIGCFEDIRESRILSKEGVKLLKNSPSACIDFCVQTGHSFAGVEYGNECFCGDTSPSANLRRETFGCNMTCAGTNSSTCGGYLRVEVYSTGIVPKKSAVTDLPQLAETRQAKIAFLLSLNGRSARQVRRLLKVIYRPHHFYYIHVDARQDYLFREMLKLEGKLPNLKVARKRLSTIWGGASLLKMLLRSFAEALNFEWDFILNLSESDFPVKSVERLSDFLGANMGKNFVKSHGWNTAEFMKKQGLDRTFYECDQHMWRIGSRKLPRGIKFDGGSDWVVLHRSYVEFLVNGNSELVEGLKVLYNYTLLPAESFFHVVLLNSKFCSAYVDSNLRLTHWKRSQGCQCQYKHVVDWCGCSPMVFRIEDYGKIDGLRERQIYFARKFEGFISQTAITKLEAELVTSPVNSTSLNSYWENAYHYQDLHPSPNQAMMTLAQATIDMASLLLSLDGQCAVEASSVLELTHYFSDDNYHGSLIMFKTSSHDTLEVKIQPIREYVKKEPLGRLINLRVGPDYDVKERVFRNPSLSLGALSDFYIEHKWTPSDSAANVTFYWLDPGGAIALNEILLVEANSTEKVLWTKKKFSEDLEPGSWTLLASVDNTLLGYIEFPVFPDLSLQRMPHRKQKEEFLQESPKVVQDFVASRPPFIDAPSTKLLASSLFKKYYSIQDVCLVDYPRLRNCFKKLPRCGDTNWSSVSPDPKSEFP